MARAISTVLDAALCLLLVSAAVVTLTLAVPVEDPPDAAEPAAVVATSTAAIDAPAATVHDTHAGHLAAAAVLRGLPGGDDAYPAAVAERVESATGDRVSVVARWSPTTTGALAGTVRSGPAPPDDAAVGVATMTVETGLPPVDEAATGSYAAVAGGIAGPLLAWMFPPTETRLALLDPARSDATAARYRGLADALAVEVEPAIRARDAAAANRRLADALAGDIEQTLRAETESPVAAAGEPSTVEIVIRRWD